MAMSSQTNTKNKRTLRTGFLILSAILYTFGIVVAVLSARDSAGEYIFMVIGLPTIMLLFTILVVLFVWFWLRFWYWWLPNWLAFIVGLPQIQAVGVYAIILALLGVAVFPFVYGFFGAESVNLYITMYVAIGTISVWRVWLVFKRVPDNSHRYLTKLGDGEKPTKSQVLAHPGRSSEHVARILTYNRIASQSPELPQYDTFEGQLFACMQSFAALQQGIDTEDPRLSRELRAAIMSQYISLAASNLRHKFLISELQITHLRRLKNAGQDGNTAALFGLIVSANLSESIVPTDDQKEQKSTAISTPFYIELHVISGELLIRKVELQESLLEQSLLHGELEDFSHRKGLLYVPRLAPSLIPKAGLLASSGVVRKWSLASNFLAGHTERHAFYLLSVQPYLRIHRDATYVIGCTIVPKTHDRIIVADKNSALYKHAILLPIQRISTESSDFSARYGIFIGQESTVPSLELLNPAFMQALLELPYEISIEVVGRHIYVYLPTKHISQVDFNTVLEIMQFAHKELRL